MYKVSTRYGSIVEGVLAGLPFTRTEKGWGNVQKIWFFMKDVTAQNKEEQENKETELFSYGYSKVVDFVL